MAAPTEPSSEFSSLSSAPGDGGAASLGEGNFELTACAGSDDWFRFTADAGAAISASINFTQS